MPSAKKHKAQSHHPAPVKSGNKTSQDKKASNTPPPPTSKHLPTSHTTKSQGARAREKEKTAEEEKNQDTHEGEQDVDVDAKFPLKNMAPVGSNRRLTPLQAKLAAKLQGAHFRMLNEELYTTPSSSAVALFKQDPSLFDTYHQGFRSQTTKWPVNPVNVMLKYLNKHPSWIIADLGCGDAKIAQNLGKARVHSFDLVSVNDLVTACDIAHVPLADQAVDAVVLSLALMGPGPSQSAALQMPRLPPRLARIVASSFGVCIRAGLDAFKAPHALLACCQWLAACVGVGQ